MTTRPTPYQYMNRGNPSTGMGQFQYYQGTFKEAIANSKDGIPGSPFKNVIIGGTKDYQDTDNFGDDARLELESVFTGTSGYVHLRMNPGWQGLFYVKSENNDFFEDNAIDETKYGNWNNDDSFLNELGEALGQLENEWPSIWVQDNDWDDSRTIFGLDQNDYLSFDVDAESGSVAQARVRIKGVDYIDNTESSNELFITCIWLRYWNPDLPSADPEPQPTPEPEPSPEPTVCPPGFKDNGFGICIPDNEGEEEEEEEEESDDEVSAAAMVAVVVGIGLVIFLAVRVV